MSEPLNTPYPMAEVEKAENTKERILLEATLLFARKGCSAVSMRDIAQKVDIQVASLYNHYDSKKTLWSAVLENIKTLYLLYFKRLDDAIALAKTFRETVDCMFAELHHVVNIFTYYGFSLVLSEQFHDAQAYEICNEYLLKHSINFIEEKFQACIDAGKCKYFDARSSATCFMHSVLFGITLRAQEDMGRETPYDVDHMLQKLHQFFLNEGELETGAQAHS